MRFNEAYDAWVIAAAESSSSGTVRLSVQSDVMGELRVWGAGSGGDRVAALENKNKAIDRRSFISSPKTNKSVTCAEDLNLQENSTHVVKCECYCYEFALMRSRAMDDRFECRFETAGMCLYVYAYKCCVHVFVCVCEIECMCSKNISNHMCGCECVMFCVCIYVCEC